MKKGFTLIELMIVVAIIAILAMIAVPMFQRYMEQAHNSSAQAVLHNIGLAQASLTNDGEDACTAMTQEDFDQLSTFGFRPDPNVGLLIRPGTTGSDTTYEVWAAHKANGSSLFVYSDTSGSDAILVDTDAKAKELNTVIPDKLYIITTEQDGTDNAGNPKYTINTDTEVVITGPPYKVTK